MNNLQLTKGNQNKWFHNIVVFLAPVGILYLTTVIGVLSTDGHMIAVKDFIPNNFMLGGMALYFLNAIYDYLRKLKG